jgi:U3 small nucleolar RNA-associated protein 10
MNAEVLLQVFLPYHASPNFARILAIISLPNESAYHVPFAPLVKNAQPVPRSYITTVIAPEREKSLRLLEDVAGMLSVAIAEGAVHRALIAFWSGVMVELIDKSAKGKGLSEGLVKVLVETFVTVLSTRSGGKDVNVSSLPSETATPLILGRRIPSAHPPDTIDLPRRRALRGHPHSSSLGRLWCGRISAFALPPGHLERSSKLGQRSGVGCS